MEPSREITEADRRRLREARAKLRAAKCTCLPHPHDMFDIKCERTVAEIAVDNALTAMGIEI